MPTSTSYNSSSSNYYYYYHNNNDKKPSNGEDDKTNIHLGHSTASSSSLSRRDDEGSSSVMMMMIKKVGLGFVGAAHACMVVVIVAAVAVAVGVGLVRFWLEEPIFLKEKLHFDYTQIHPNALYSFSPPVGHMFQVSVSLLMPESQYNRQLGIFQLRAEIVGGENCQVIAKSSEACMLRFRSLPIRMMRVLVLGLPILFGMSNEAQKVHVVMLKHKQQQAAAGSRIRVTLIPRAGTVSLPQVYEAHLFVQSHLPFFKRILHRWKWTLYVWASMNIFMMMLVIMICFCKPSVILCGPTFFLINWSFLQHRSAVAADDHIHQQVVIKSSELYDDDHVQIPPPPPTPIRIGTSIRRRRRRQVVARSRDDDEVSEVLMRMRLVQRIRRSKRKAAAAAATLLFSDDSASTSSTITTHTQLQQEKEEDSSESVNNNNNYQCNVA